MKSLKDLFSADFISCYCENFNKEQDVREKALQEVFSKYHDTQKESEILIKVVLLNHIYSAGLNGNPPLEENKDKKRHVDVYEMSKRLSTIAADINTLFHDESEPYVAVNKIIDLFSDECYYKPYSFATKYCNFHNPEKYPIADSFSKGVLYNYFERRYKQALFNDYEEFCKIYKRFKCGFIETFSIKEIDKFLWMFGKEKKMKI